MKNVNEVIEQLKNSDVTGTTKTYIDDVNKNVEHLVRRTSSLESRTNHLYLQSKDIKETMVTRQDLENQRKDIEDEFKNMLNRSMYIVFALFFMMILFGYFF